jgi:Dr1-associated corepressor
MDYRPSSPDLSNIKPESPNLTGRPQSPDLSSAHFAGSFNQHHGQFQAGRLIGSSALGGSNYGGPTSYAPPTSTPVQHQYSSLPQPHHQSGAMDSPYPVKEDTEWLPDAPSAKRARKDGPKQQSRAQASNGGPLAPQSDPTLGVELKTSFPVARIKRIMQADEDIGKVAQVTPPVVSRALELFMIKLIAASAEQARGGEGSSGKASAKKITPQHLKRAVLSDSTYDFLCDIVNKVPDAPTKAKKEAGSESEDEKKPRRKGKRRKDADDI